MTDDNEKNLERLTSGAFHSEKKTFSKVTEKPIHWGPEDRGKKFCK